METMSFSDVVKIAAAILDAPFELKLYSVPLESHGFGIRAVRGFPA
jgi:hypothetical protein